MHWTHYDASSNVAWNLSSSIVGPPSAKACFSLEIANTVLRIDHVCVVAIRVSIFVTRSCIVVYFLNPHTLIFRDTAVLKAMISTESILSSTGNIALLIRRFSGTYAIMLGNTCFSFFISIYSRHPDACDIVRRGWRFILLSSSLPRFRPSVQVLLISYCWWR